MRQTTKKASHVLSVKRDKILFRKKIIQSSQPTTFSFKGVELATFSFKIATFLFKISIFFFYWNCRARPFHFFKTVKFATFSLKTIKFATFIHNCLVCHFFSWHCRARYFFLFSIVMGSLLCYSKPSTLSLSFDPACLLFYWKRSSSLLFIRNCRVCYFFQFKSGEKYPVCHFFIQNCLERCFLNKNCRV